MRVWPPGLDKSNRKALLDAINTTVDPIAIAKRAIRENGRTADEPKLPPLPLGDAHSAAALRYQKRNVADGKCSLCPSRLARHSVRYCEKHLKVFRDRAREKSKKLNKLQHGRAIGTLKALAGARERRRKKADQ